MSHPTWRSFAVVPAAGSSRRMGRHKLLLPWREKTIIEHVLAAWSASRVDHVVVVVRPDDANLAAAVQRMGVDVAAPPSAPPEMKDSVAFGLDYLEARFRPQAHDAWLLAPADVPRLVPDVIDRLLAAHNPEAPQVLAPVCGGRRGHPVLFPWRRAVEVRQLPADRGIDSLVRDAETLEIEVDLPAIHEDLDTPEDYRRLQ